jgi:galactitol PTS system EIIC component
VRGLNFPVLDVGWPPLAAITWASPLAAISIPMVIVANLAMLATGLTRTIYIDTWNFWHFALIGALVLALSGSMLLGLSATMLIAIYCFKMAEWTAVDVERETGLKGISASPVSVNGIAPYTACVDWVIDRIPVLNKMNYNPQAAQAGEEAAESNNLLDLLREPMVIGLLMGLALALAADYDARLTLEMSVHIAAVMFLLPKSAGLIGEAMVPITQALRGQIERVFPKRKNLVVAMDTGFLMGHKVLPGNKVLPLGDLPNLISVMSVSVLMFRGNVFRAVLAGIPVIVSFLLISSSMSPLFTDLARKTPSFSMEGLGQITAFTDGGHQIRFLIFHLYQGAPWAFGVLVLLLGAMVFTKKRSDVLTATSA